MRILYGIQGTGNGHIARAEDVVPVLREYGQVDLLVSGAQADLDLPLDVRFRSRGLSFYFGKKGGVDVVKTIRKNKSGDVLREIRNFPIENYDCVVNDFEPISAWAAKLREVPSVALSHQASLLSPEVPRPRHFDPVGVWMLSNYAPASKYVGFHFKAFSQQIFTPVVRKRVRSLKRENKGHFTVYLPAYEDKKVLIVLSQFPHVKWHVFSKHSRIRYRIGDIEVHPVNNQLFTLSMAGAEGVICGAGFETPAETLFLGKRLMVIPMKRQYEQHCNAEALKQMGVPVLPKFRKRYVPLIEEWMHSAHWTRADYPDVTRCAIEKALAMIAQPDGKSPNIQNRNQ